MTIAMIEIADLLQVQDPIALFSQWYQTVETAGQSMPEAMALATANRNGHPSVRFVLLKEVSSGGFCFFTNYNSRKASDLDDNPWAALAFHWVVVGRQVRVCGPVEKLSMEENAAYAHTRPRDSQIGAWASKQSQPLLNDAELSQRFASIEEKFLNQEIPCPPFWGGYRVIPYEIEFWINRADRLHDRIVFRRKDQLWSLQRLFP